VKQINGRDVGPRALGEYIKAYANVFREGHLPKALTLVEAISFTTNICAKDEAYSIYKQEMDKKCLGSDALSKEELSALNNSAKAKAFEKFDSQATFGNKENIVMTRKELEAQVLSEYDKYVKGNKYKMQSGLEKYIIPIIAAISAYILDSVTDWTCDSWSTTCQRLSKLSAIIYYVVFLIIGFEFYRVYQKQGGAAVGITAMGLGQATIQKVDDVRHTIASSFARPTKDKDKEERKKKDD